MWVQSQAIESIAPKFGAHVALTGGCLYKDGERKDLDTVGFNIMLTQDFGWCKKAVFFDKKIDFLFPESTGSEYP